MSGSQSHNLRSVREGFFLRLATLSMIAETQ